MVRSNCFSRTRNRQRERRERILRSREVAAWVREALCEVAGR